MQLKSALTGLINNFFSARYRLLNLQLNSFSIIFLFIGTATGIYFVLTKLIIPQVWAVSDRASNWVFDATNSSNYTYDSNLVVVDDDGARPVDNANKLSNASFSTDSSSWNVGAIAPEGWIVAPGNPQFYSGDYDGDFLIMKYEAKAWDTQTGTVIADGGTSRAGSWAGNNGQTRYQARSIVAGRPWVRIAANHSTAFDSIEACSVISLGSTNAHLITNNEWMTLGRDAQAQAVNWTNGVVGSGSLFRGNTNTTASKDASDPLSGVNTRRLTLSNGSVVWDMPGNVGEWTSDTHQTPINTVAAWVEWNSGNVRAGAKDLYGPAGGYLSGQGMGRLYGGAIGNAILRVGGWSDDTMAGMFSLGLYRPPTDTNDSIGFRCASDPVDVVQTFASDSGRAGGGNTVSVGQVTDGKIYQSINVGDTSTYDFSVYVYDNTEGNVGGTLDSSVAELYYNGSILTTTYTDMGSGWWELSGTLSGANEVREYGVLVHQGKTVVVDDFTLAKQGEYSLYTTLAFGDPNISFWDDFCEGTITAGGCSNDGVTASGSAAVKYQVCVDDGSACSYAGEGSRWQFFSEGAWANSSSAALDQANDAAELTTEAMQALPIDSQKLAVKALFDFGGEDVPVINGLSVGLSIDDAAPTSNASNIVMYRQKDGSEISGDDWTNNPSPHFTWSAGADDPGGKGLKGYCLYLGIDASGDPETSKGLLGDSPVSVDGTTCQFIVAATSIDLATTTYKGDPWLSSSSQPYYLNIKAIDNAGNIYEGAAEQFQFLFDSTVPTNVSYVSCPGGSFASVADMNFSWPISGSTAATDDHAGVIGWQYQINSTNGDWQGLTSGDLLGVGSYIPTTESALVLTDDRDGSAIVTGSNIVYFRAIDAAGNISNNGTVRTCSLEFGGLAPTFGGTDVVSISPESSTSNSYSLSWPEATPANGRTIAAYYYMVNTSAPSSLATLTGNPSTYFSTGTTTSVDAAALPNVNKGSNTVRVVAVDDADNYSPSNAISGTLTLDSSNPDNVGNLVASDSSIKSESKWYVTLTWSEPVYQGAGNHTYLIYRSDDGLDFSQVGSTSGLSYVDNTPSSARYYYKVYTQDGADAKSSGTNAVSIIPTGRYTSAPSLSSGPSVSSITTKKAKISWSTSRTADSKVAFGTSSGSYNDEEPSNSNQVTDHSITLAGLTPGTKYYYKVKWTDEDGNTGLSDEQVFTTQAAPTVFDVDVKNIDLDSGIIQYTVKGASKVKIYYGKTTSFGGMIDVSTSTSEATYTTQLTDLEDDMKYHFKINAFDSENAEYEGTILSFTTLPRPKISGVRLEQVANTAQTTVRVTWSTNTEVSSIVSFWPTNDASASRDEVNVKLISGNHSLFVRGLLPQTNYSLVVKGRDKLGNEAVSDTQTFNTATDTRPPQIHNLKVIGGTIPPVGFAAGEVRAQLIVTWDTDEPASGQVEFGEGSGSSYSQKSQYDGNLSTNHTVILSNLTPSRVYHLRVLSKDSAENETKSVDTVTIAPKATHSAFDLVIKNLSEAFGFVSSVKISGQ